MDADRTPSARGRPTEPGSWHGVPGGDDGTRRNGTDRTPTSDGGPGHSDGGGVLTDLLDPGPSTGSVEPAAVPEDSDLFDELVTRRRSTIDPRPMRTSHAPARGRARRHGRIRRGLGWTYAVAIVVLAVSVTVGVTSRAHLQRTDAQLAAVRTRLHQTVRRARTAEAGLTAVTGQATSAADLLASETAQLASVQSQLAATEANVFANGVSINNLDTCLSGVEQALNQISLGDQPDAATTLDGVAASCRAAAPAP